MDDDEKMRRAKALDLARRQANADAARLMREGVPSQRGSVADALDPQNPNVVVSNDNSAR